MENDRCSNFIELITGLSQDCHLFMNNFKTRHFYEKL